MQRLDALSPRARGRITGVVYLLFFLTAVLGALVAPGISGLGGTTSDAAATASGIVGNQAAARLGWALGLVSTAFYVALMALFYVMFRPVGRTVALVAAFFGLTGCAVTAFGSLFQLAPLLILSGDSYLSAFDAHQLQALALLSLNLNVQVGYIALAFFGCFQLALGYLIYRSGFLPRLLGILIAVAGVGWLLFLAPPLATRILGPLEILGFVAEAALMLWLIVMGAGRPAAAATP